MINTQLRVIDPSGYVKIFDPSHTRYNWEHRMVMENHLDRLLTEEEHIHHINGDKSDNRIENLEIHTNSDHKKLHWNLYPHEKKEKISSKLRASALIARKSKLNNRLKEAKEIFCSCGCGEKLISCDSRGRSKTFIHGHNAKGKHWTWRLSK